jgi:hypothetical protein
MRLLKNRQNLVSFAMIALLLVLALPGYAFANQRGRGRGRDHNWRDRKCGKFVNCHDARDGRWDGRGPRRDWDGRFSRRDRFNDRFDRRHNRFDRFDRFDDRDRWRRARFNQRFGRDDFRFRNRINRGFDAREVNRFNTIRFRRSRG